MESFKEVFIHVSEFCKEEISAVGFNLWISCIEPVSFDGKQATLSVKSGFQKKIIVEKYLDLLHRAFENVLGFPVDINLFAEDDDSENAQAAEEAMRTMSREQIEHSSSGGEYEYTFDTFIVGASNKFAHAASLAVATNPSGTYNPLFIYGGSGLGKTHLLYAICAEIAHNFKDKNILYVKGEEFTNELIEAIREGTTAEFHAKYRNADVLLVDDIQFIAGKDRTQEEFFHTFNTLYHAGRQIVLTSDRPPKEIKTLEDRLRTRFEWGLLADIQPPDFETRVAIIRRKSQLLDIEIPDDVADYIANRLKTNIRQLEGVVKKLKAYKLLTDTSPSVSVAQNAIRDILHDNTSVPVTIERIISEVGKTFSVSPEDIRSSKRAAQISLARQVSMYVVRDITGMSLSAIGEEFGKRDHSTVVYALKQVEQDLKVNDHFKEVVDDIIKNIRNL